MKIKIAGRTSVVKNHLEDDEEPIQDLNVLREITSKNQLLIDSQEPDLLFQNFFEDGTDVSTQVVDAIASGGWVSLELDTRANQINVVTEYETKRDLSQDEIDFLVSRTVAQWSDGGGGATLDHFSDEIEPYYVDPYPFLEDYDPDEPEVTIVAD